MHLTAAVDRVGQVWLDHEDVTDMAFEVVTDDDTGRGYVKMFVTPFERFNDWVATEQRFGNVKVTFNA